LNVSPDCSIAYADTSNSITVTVSGSRFDPTGIQENSAAGGITINPNPVQRVLNLSAYGVANGDARIEITDIVGAVVHRSISQAHDGSLSVYINVAHLPAGLYLVSITDAENNRRVMKCVKN